MPQETCSPCWGSPFQRAMATSSIQGCGPGQQSPVLDSALSKELMGCEGTKSPVPQQAEPAVGRVGGTSRAPRLGHLWLPLLPCCPLWFCCFLASTALGPASALKDCRQEAPWIAERKPRSTGQLGQNGQRLQRRVLVPFLPAAGPVTLDLRESSRTLVRAVQKAA